MGYGKKIKYQAIGYRRWGCLGDVDWFITSGWKRVRDSSQQPLL
jgi:hypothetical protein